MDREQRRASALASLRRASGVVSRCLALADEGDEYFASHRSECERLRADLLLGAEGDAGTKRLTSLSRDVGARLERLERGFLADKDRRLQEASRQAEQVESLRRYEAKLRLDAQERRPPIRSGPTLGIIYDMRNEGPG